MGVICNFIFKGIYNFCSLCEDVLGGSYSKCYGIYFYFFNFMIKIGKVL